MTWVSERILRLNDHWQTDHPEVDLSDAVGPLASGMAAQDTCDWSRSRLHRMRSCGRSISTGQVKDSWD